MSNIEKMELRFMDAQMESTDDGSLKVSGYVNKTNQWSEELGTRSKFVERIERGSFNKALQRGNEVHFYAEHDPKQILASTRNGSLNLREDDKGLYMEATIEPTSWGKDYYTLIKRGIIQNMSFGMKVLKDDWKKRSDGMNERTISDLYLAEVSAVRNPAYAQSTIAARGIDLVEDVEPVEEKQEQKPVAEQRELTPAEQLAFKKRKLNMYKTFEKLGELSAEEERDMKIIEKEVNQMETLFDKQTAPIVKEQSEQRAVTTGMTGGNNTSAGYINGDPLFDSKTFADFLVDTKKFPYLATLFNIFAGKTQQRVPFAFDGAEAGIYDDMVTTPNTDPNLTEIDFKQKRVASVITLSRVARDNLHLDTIVRTILAKRTLTTWQSQAFGKGNSDGSGTQFQSILDYNSLPVATSSTPAGTVTKINGASISTWTGANYDNFNLAYEEYFDNNVEEPIIVVDSVATAMSILNPAQYPILDTDDVRIPGSIGNIYGIPVFKQNMQGKAKMILMNPKAYAVSIAEDANVQLLQGDTTQEMAGSVTYLGEVYSKGMVVNPYAIKIIN